MSSITDCGAPGGIVAATLDSSVTGGTVTVTDEDNYELMALSSSGNSFTIAKAPGTRSRTCSAAGVSTGGCSATSWCAVWPIRPFLLMGDTEGERQHR